MTTTATQRYKNDARLRKRLFVPSAFAHPAKGHISLWQEMILRYSNEGDLVLDPMAGIGTSLLAALMGRNVICVELEQHFVEPMRRSWEKMRTMPMLGYQVGQAVIVRGDARALPLPDASAEAVVTSPPFQDTGASQGVEANARWVTSERVHHHIGYTRPVDAIVTSPPFHDTGNKSESGGEVDYFRKTGEWRTGLKYSEAPENIGNMKGAAYWGENGMTAVYRECWRVLKPGGILALVLKGFTRDGQYVDLPGQTEALLLAAGWEKHDHWRRELWGLSFWRTLQKRRDPAAFDERLKYEEVRAYRKPGAEGQGVAAVITSPPYENSELPREEHDNTRSDGLHPRYRYTRHKT